MGPRSLKVSGFTLQDFLLMASFLLVSFFTKIAKARFVVCDLLVSMSAASFRSLADLCGLGS